MSNILIIGTGPLPGPEVEKSGAAALRTWQIARPLLESPHKIRLIALPDEDAAKNATAPQETTLEHEAFPYVMPNVAGLAEAADYLAKTVEEFAPDCIVAVNLYPAYAASLIAGNCPLWVDLPDPAMASAQVSGERMQSDDLTEATWKRVAAVLSRADKLSVISMPQLYLLLGELGMLGRVNHQTAHYHFAHHIPAAVHPYFARPTPPAARSELRRGIVPQDAFVVLWSGGFDATVDIETLVESLNKAMSLNAQLHFVATGAEIHTDESAYQHLRATIKSSPYQERFHLLGWVPTSTLPLLYREADLGISIDAMTYETLFSSRFRLINMMAAGLPVLSTIGSELSHILKEEQIGLTAAVADPDAIAELIVRASRHVHDTRAMGQKARGYVTRHFSSTTLARPLREWVDNADLAPDNTSKAAQANGHHRLQDVALNAIQQRFVVPAEVEEKPTRGGAASGSFSKNWISRMIRRER